MPGVVAAKHTPGVVGAPRESARRGSRLAPTLGTLRMVEPPVVTQIEIRTVLPWISFVWRFFKTVVTIDGDKKKLPWGVHRIDVPPGRHHVTISVPYLGFEDRMANGVVVDVAPGSVMAVRYTPQPSALRRGDISVWVVAPGGGQFTQGWYADPTGRHALRYWNGDRWTEHVSDGDRTAIDRLADAPSVTH
jgi:hypothetical protein